MRGLQRGGPCWCAQRLMAVEQAAIATSEMLPVMMPLLPCLQVCATCVGAGDARVSALRFQHVLVDECTQASEPEALIPLVLGAKQVGPSTLQQQPGPEMLVHAHHVCADVMHAATIPLLQQCHIVVCACLAYVPSNLHAESAQGRLLCAACLCCRVASGHPRG